MKLIGLSFIVRMEAIFLLASHPRAEAGRMIFFKYEIIIVELKISVINFKIIIPKVMNHLKFCPEELF